VANPTQNSVSFGANGSEAEPEFSSLGRRLTSLQFKGEPKLELIFFRAKASATNGSHSKPEYLLFDGDGLPLPDFCEAELRSLFLLAQMVPNSNSLMVVDFSMMNCNALSFVETHPRQTVPTPESELLLLNPCVCLFLLTSAKWNCNFLFLVLHTHRPKKKCSEAEQELSSSNAKKLDVMD
jgi:hypothetical protein